MPSFLSVDLQLYPLVQLYIVEIAQEVNALCAIAVRLRREATTRIN